MGYRLIDVNAKEYGYIIGNKVLKVKGPEGEGSKIAPLFEVLGITEALWLENMASRCDAGCNCGPSAPSYMSVTPAKVAEYIRKNFPQPKEQ